MAVNWPAALFRWTLTMQLATRRQPSGGDGAMSGRVLKNAAPGAALGIVDDDFE
jgi:hypothetical protein